MKRLAFLFRPQWLALIVVVIAFAYLCFTVLAPWQLGKNTKTSRENGQISRSLTAEPVPVTSVLPQQDSSAPDEQWQRVTATGHYLPDGQVLARLRVVEGDPAFEVLVPFAVDGGPTVLVDRGYIKPEQGSRVPAFAPPPTQTVTITARLRDSETAPPRARRRSARMGRSRCTPSTPPRSPRWSEFRWPGPTCSWSRISRAGSASSPCRISTPGLSCPTASSGSRSASWPRSGWATSWFRRSRHADARRRPSGAARRMPHSPTEEKLADRYGKRR